MRLASLILCAAMSFLPVAAQAQSPRLLDRAALESLLAPIALYPDDVLAEVLGAARDPARLALLPYDELRERMQDSPEWTQNLGYAYLWQPSDVWRVVHALRLRAGSLGYQPMVVHQVGLWRPRQVIVVSNSYGTARSPNGPPSVAAQMQRGNQPSPAARMQQQRPPIHQPVVQPRHEDRHHHGERKHRQ